MRLVNLIKPSTFLGERERAKLELEAERAQAEADAEPDKEEIQIAADHASKLAAKFEKIHQKELKKAEKSKMPMQRVRNIEKLVQIFD